MKKKKIVGKAKDKENIEIQELLKNPDLVKGSIILSEKLPSSQVLNLMKDAANEFSNGLESSFQTLAERWAIIKKKGMAQGFTEQEMQEFMKIYLEDVLSNSQIKYLFNPDYYKDKSKLQYERLKLANISQNVDKNDTEKLSIGSQQELNPELDLLAETIGLSREKKTMIANKRLKDHPYIQRELIEDTKDISNESAKERVAQTIMDLETGVIEDNGDGNYIRHSGKRDKIQKKPKTEYPIFNQFHLVGEYCKFMKSLTGLDVRELELNVFKDEKEDYDEDYEAAKNIMLSQAKKYQIETIKIADKRTLIAINNDLIWLMAASKQMYDLIQQELRDRENKEELTKE